MQTREKVKGFWCIKEKDYEIAIGSNTDDKEVEDCFAIGEIIAPNATRWTHLKLSDIKRIIEKHEASESAGMGEDRKKPGGTERGSSEQSGDAMGSPAPRNVREPSTPAPEKCMHDWVTRTTKNGKTGKWKCMDCKKKHGLEGI